MEGYRRFFRYLALDDVGKWGKSEFWHLGHSRMCQVRRKNTRNKQLKIEPRVLWQFGKSFTGLIRDNIKKVELMCS